MKTRYVVLAIPAAFVLAWLGRIGVMVLDTLAGGVRWIGIDSPIAGWGFLGAVIGAAVGAHFGLQRAGRALHRASVFGLSTVLFLGLAYIGARPPLRTPEVPVYEVAPMQTSLYTARVVGGGVNLRSGPAPSASVLGTLSGGTEVEVLEVRLNWMRVRVRNGPATGNGWAYKRYLQRL